MTECKFYGAEKKLDGALVVAFIGRKGVGKSFVADAFQRALEKKGVEVKRMALATPIKESWVGFFGEQKYECFYNPKLKEGVTLYGFTPRHLMQWVSDVYKKKFGRNIFVRLLIERIEIDRRELWYGGKGKDNVVYIVDDMRYLDEYRELKERYGDEFIVVLVNEEGFIPKPRVRDWIIHYLWSIYPPLANFLSFRLGNYFDHISEVQHKLMRPDILAVNRKGSDEIQLSNVCVGG